MDKKRLVELLENFPDIKSLFTGEMKLYLSYGTDDYIPVSTITPIDIEFENGKKLSEEDLKTIIDYGFLKDCYLSCDSEKGMITIPLRKMDILMYFGSLNNGQKDIKSNLDELTNYKNNEQLIDIDSKEPDNGLTTKVTSMLECFEDYSVNKISIPIAKIAEDYDCSDNYSIVPFAKNVVTKSSKRFHFTHSQK